MAVWPGGQYQEYQGSLTACPARRTPISSHKLRRYRIEINTNFNLPGLHDLIRMTKKLTMDAKSMHVICQIALTFEEKNIKKKSRIRVYRLWFLALFYSALISS